MEASAGTAGEPGQPAHGGTGTAGRHPGTGHTGPPAKIPGSDHPLLLPGVEGLGDRPEAARSGLHRDGTALTGPGTAEGTSEGVVL